MTGGARDLLSDYVLGALSEDELEAFERELAESEALQAELRETADGYEALAASLPPVTPAPGGRDRLLAAIEGSDRFLPFVNDIARYCDLAWERIRELCRRIDDAASWEPGPLPGISLIHFDGGPNAVASDTGFVKFAGGTVFPHHRHHGFEVNYVMSGAIIDDDGRRYGPGEAIEKTEKDAHSFKIPDGEETIIFVAQSGFEIVVPE